MTARIAAGAGILASALLAAASVFFCYYTLRLMYLAEQGLIDEAHRTAGLRIGAAVFPVASFAFGWISLICAKWAKQRFRSFTGARTRTAIPSGSDSDL